MKTIIVLLSIGAILYGVYMYERWRWNECRKVGHGVAYCIFIDRSK